MIELTPLEKAIMQVESQGKLDAIGDKHLVNKAYGAFQIRKPCVEDVKQYTGSTIYKHEDGKVVDIKAENCLNDLELSVWIFRQYMARWANEKRIVRTKPGVTDQDRARIWNGGPRGWMKKSTEHYWSKVQNELFKNV